MYSPQNTNMYKKLQKVHGTAKVQGRHILNAYEMHVDYIEDVVGHNANLGMVVN